jgi:tripartite-type tricarboxylate transporter receptor subunit TctC
MFRAFRLSGQSFFLPPETPREIVGILREAMRKTLNDPEFHKEFHKLTGDNPTPLMPEALDKAIKEMPRDADVVELFNKLAGPGPLPPR